MKLYIVDRKSVVFYGKISELKSHLKELNHRYTTLDEFIKDQLH